MSASVAEHDYLIIGGATRSATTSLFHYLSEHPRVCAASSKETRFFLDREYPLPSRLRHDDGLERYETFYRHCSADCLRLEATSDYLYSPGTPARIARALPRARVLFILREPTARLLSWYRFARQTDRVAQGMTLTDYVALQREVGPDAPQHLRALAQGRYSTHLARWIETLGPQRIQVQFSEELSGEPLRVLGRICREAGIDPGFYDGYSFRRHNPGQAMRSAALHRLYMRTRFEVRNRFLGRPRARAALGGLRRVVEPFYRRLNVSAREQADACPPELSAELRRYYADERQALERLIGRSPPWPE